MPFEGLSTGEHKHTQKGRDPIGSHRSAADLRAGLKTILNENDRQQRQRLTEIGRESKRV